MKLSTKFALGVAAIPAWIGLAAMPMTAQAGEVLAEQIVVAYGAPPHAETFDTTAPATHLITLPAGGLYRCDSNLPGGDPAPGTDKKCYQKRQTPAGEQVVLLASEGDYFRVWPNAACQKVQVAFAEAVKENVLFNSSEQGICQSRSFECGTDLFGDPSKGKDKSCFINVDGTWHLAGHDGDTLKIPGPASCMCNDFDTSQAQQPLPVDVLNGSLPEPNVYGSDDDINGTPINQALKHRVNQ